MDELRALAALGRLGTPAAAWNASLAKLGARVTALAAVTALPGAPPAAVLDADLAWIEASGTRLLDCASAGFPAELAAIRSAPAILYVQGEVAVLSTPQIAMIGSRSPSSGGRSTAHEFAVGLARAGFTITSGLARGIDAASHAGALAAPGRTIAVFGTGLDTVYPPEHERLAARILEGGGALVSELPPGSPPQREGFPRRNRLISGLARAVLVVEAAPDSGSFRTAGHARRQGRPLFAVPGSIRNPLARGCHALIRAGARLVGDPDELLADLDIPVLKQSLELFPARPPSRPELDKDREILLDALGFDPISFDVLVERTGFLPESVASLLLLLELDGFVESLPGGHYGRIQQAPG